MFLSKVPILKDLYLPEKTASQVPGPGAYFDEGSPETLQSQARVVRESQHYAIEEPQKIKSYISLSPGHYQPDEEKEKNRQKFLLIYREPLSSSRVSKKRVKHAVICQDDPQAYLGPGSYIDINKPEHSSFSKVLVKNRNQKCLQELSGVKPPPFGSKTARMNTDRSSNTQEDLKCFGLGNEISLTNQEKIEEIKVNLMMKMRLKKHTYLH